MKLSDFLLWDFFYVLLSVLNLSCSPKKDDHLVVVSKYLNFTYFIGITLISIFSVKVIVLLFIEFLSSYAVPNSKTSIKSYSVI